MNMVERVGEPPAIACTLGPADFKARLATIAALNSAALLSHRRDDLRLELVYAVKARAQVLEMVRSEQACCAFLTFEIRDEAGGVHVIIEAPEGAREAAETVFEPFRSKAVSQAACPCCGPAL
jgi:hypothetical protein